MRSGLPLLSFYAAVLIDQQPKAGDSVAAELVHDLHDRFIGNSTVSGNDDRSLWRDHGLHSIDQVVFGYGLEFLSRITQAQRDSPFLINLDFYRFDRHIGSTPDRRQFDDAGGDHGSGHHEDDEQHQHYVDVGNDVDFILQPPRAAPAVPNGRH